MKDLKINTNNEDNPVFKKGKGHNAFNQLAVKIKMDHVSDDAYFKWLDQYIKNTSEENENYTFLEKEGVRTEPPLNTAVYYDTKDHMLLPTGALLRTSCNKITHAFCAFKLPEDSYGNRLDRRYVFEGNEKKIIQMHPYSSEAVKIVKGLLSRTDIDHPGYYFEKHFGISTDSLFPSVILFGHRSTFYALIDGMDALRCSIDRSEVFDIRKDPNKKNLKQFREVELSIYPRISEKLSSDSRVIELINDMKDSLIDTFNTEVIYEIKYQRAAQLLGINY